MRTKLWLFCLILGIISINVVYAGAVSPGLIDVSLINQNPDPAQAGETVEIRFSIENTGDEDANDLTLELLPEYPFSKLSGEEYVKTIKTLSAYQQGKNAVIIKYKVRIDKDAVKGDNDLKLKISGIGLSSSLIRTFKIEVKGKEFAQIIYLDKAKIDPGKETDLKYIITNVGGSPLKNLVFSWNEEDGIVLPVYSDDTKYIRYLDVGESVDLDYIVVADVNAQPGLYQLNLNLKFDDEEGTSQEINTKAGVFVGGETDFDVTFSESSAGQTSLSVANTGNNPALSVTVRVPPQEGFSVSGSTSSIIGNLDKGDYTIVSFQITSGSGYASMGVDRGSSGRGELSEEEREELRQQMYGRSNNLEVIIEYTDTTGVRQTLEKTVPIQFRSLGAAEGEESIGMYSRGSRQQQSNIGYWIALIVIVGAVGMFFWSRKRKLPFISKILRKKIKI